MEGLNLINERVTIFLTNSFRYTGVVTAENNDFITIQDERKNTKQILAKAHIRQITIDKPHNQAKRGKSFEKSFFVFVFFFCKHAFRLMSLGQNRSLKSHIKNINSL